MRSDGDVQEVVDFVQSKEFADIIESTDYVTSWRDDVVLYAPLVFAGKKTGGLTTRRGMSAEDATELFENAGFFCKVREWDERDGCSIYYTRDEAAVSELTVGVEDEAFGRFLGVPVEDNRWMDELDMPDSVDSIPEYLELNESDVPDIQYARLVSWLCRPTQERLEATIEIGKEWYDFAVMLEGEAGYSDARKFADSKMSQFGAWYTVLSSQPSWYDFALPFSTRLRRYLWNIVH